MKIILLQDIPKQGHKNEVKNVSAGYARNFLFPRNLAKPATEAALKTLAEQKAREAREKSEEYQKYKAMAEKMKSLTLTLKIKVGERGRAFGSVTAVKIRDALKKQGVEIEKEWIELDEPIKTTGEHIVKVKLPQNATETVKVVVAAE